MTTPPLSPAAQNEIKTFSLGSPPIIRAKATSVLTLNGRFEGIEHPDVVVVNGRRYVPECLEEAE
jgi:hypothetical protein